MFQVQVGSAVTVLTYARLTPPLQLRHRDQLHDQDDARKPSLDLETR